VQISPLKKMRKVHVKDSPRGVSTFDKPGVPKGKNWTYYKISAGTVLPAGLVIVKDHYNEYFDAVNYTIAPAYDMPLTEFKLHLNKLAASFIQEVV